MTILLPAYLQHFCKGSMIFLSFISFIKNKRGEHCIWFICDSQPQSADKQPTIMNYELPSAIASLYTLANFAANFLLHVSKWCFDLLLICKSYQSNLSLYVGVSVNCLEVLKHVNCHLHNLQGLPKTRKTLHNHFDGVAMYMPVRHSPLCYVLLVLFILM